MAEAEAEQEKWLYILRRILALVVVGVLLWIGLEFIKWGRRAARDEKSGKTLVVSTRVVNLPAQVSEFESFVRDNPASESMKLDHNYTSGGIRRLADALGAISDQQDIKGLDIKDKLDLLRGYADRLQKDQSSDEHANVVVAAFTLASDLMDSVEQHISRNLKNEVAEVRQAAEAIDPDKRLVDQKAQVETFLEKTGRLLSEMAQSRS
jgi:hypothetical protein